ncbi:MAG: DUF819 family protein [Longimicrobiales bacterium]|nr:DUF819 family protein [Longimicrobiales bacterium]
MIRDPLALAALIAGATAAAFWLDHRFPALGRLGASLIAIVLGALLSNFGVVPVASPVYDLIMGPVTSLAIAWLLLSVSLADVRRAGRRMLAAYALAALGTAVGAFTAALLFAGVFGDDTWRLAGVLTGTFTGGSVNFVAVGRAVELPEGLFAGTTAADALITGVWMGASLLLPLWLGRFYPAPPAGVAARAEGSTPAGRVGDAGAADPASPPPHERSGPGPVGMGPAGATDPEGVPHPFFLKEAVSTLDLAILGAVGVGLLLAAEFLGALVPAVPSILWLTTLALLVGQLRGMSRPRGAFPLGTLALHFFFVVIGILSRVSEILLVGVEVFWLTLVVVAVHGVVVYGGGRLARLDVATLTVASQASVGGPSSALAVAVSREWRGLVLPGIIVGLLGYAIGNYLGVSLALLVRGLGIGL